MSMRPYQALTNTFQSSLVHAVYIRHFVSPVSACGLALFCFLIVNDWYILAEKPTVIGNNRHEYAPPTLNLPFATRGTPSPPPFPSLLWYTMLVTLLCGVRCLVDCTLLLPNAGVLSSIKIKIWRWEVSLLVRPSDQSWCACTCLPTGGKWNTHRWRVLRSPPVPRSSTKHWVLKYYGKLWRVLRSAPVPRSGTKHWVLSTMASYGKYLDQPL